MSGSENQAIFPGLEAKKINHSHFARAEYFLTSFKTSSLYPQMSCHSLSKRPMFTANGDYHRKPQVDTMQKSMYQGEPSHRENIYFTVPASILWNGVLILISLIPESLL